MFGKPFRWGEPYHYPPRWLGHLLFKLYKHVYCHGEELWEDSDISHYKMGIVEIHDNEYITEMWIGPFHFVIDNGWLKPACKPCEEAESDDSLPW